MVSAPQTRLLFYNPMIPYSSSALLSLPHHLSPGYGLTAGRQSVQPSPGVQPHSTFDGNRATLSRPLDYSLHLTSSRHEALKHAWLTRCLLGLTLRYCFVSAEADAMRSSHLGEKPSTFENLFLAAHGNPDSSHAR